MMLVLRTASAAHRNCPASLAGVLRTASCPASLAGVLRTASCPASLAGEVNNWVCIYGARDEAGDDCGRPW